MDGELEPLVRDLSKLKNCRWSACTGPTTTCWLRVARPHLHQLIGQVASLHSLKVPPHRCLETVVVLVVRDWSDNWLNRKSSL